MEKVIQLIKEWHESVKIRERKRNAEEVFVREFGTEPRDAVVERGGVIVRKTITEEEIRETLGEEALALLLEIARNYCDAKNVKRLDLVVRESAAKEESDWTGRGFLYYEDLTYEVVRKRTIPGYDIKMEITGELWEEGDC